MTVTPYNSCYKEKQNCRDPCAQSTTLHLPHMEGTLLPFDKGKMFSKLDLAEAYLQMEVEEESRTVLAISTERGLFRYN